MMEKSPSSKAGPKAASLLTPGAEIAEQPRVGPLPPTPQKSSPFKRKNSLAAVEETNPFWRFRRAPDELTKPAAKRAKRARIHDLDITMNDTVPVSVEEKPFPFLQLPGEIRNLIYDYCAAMSQRQALLVHLPKTGTLRSSTRQVRAHPGKYTEPEDPEKKSVAKRYLPAETNRPYVGLTHVCRQLRAEYYPIYMGHQEAGMDFSDSVKFVETFFNPNQAMSFTDRVDSDKGKTLPFRGNVTIAISDIILPVERAPGYLDVLPLLMTWANASQIEAGFGRYSRRDYNPSHDGEAKDLYRLYGRKVFPDRSCSQMNSQWRIILREKHLAALRVHRDGGAFKKPYFHLIWKAEHRLDWMKGKFCFIPGTTFTFNLPGSRALRGSWLWKLGFGEMEHFDVRISAEQYPGEFPSNF